MGDSLKIAFGTVIYTNAMQYAKEFINSINSQTIKEFDTLIINDNVNVDLAKDCFSNMKNKYLMVHYDKVYSPAELRIMLILEAYNRGFDLLIIGDFDDCFSSDRVERIIKTVNDNNAFSFFYNTINAFDGTKVMPELPRVTDSINCISDYNYLGMSNIAIRLNSLDACFINSLFEYKDSIFDWYLFSRLLLDFKKGIFVPDAVTFYRFHNDNLVGNQDQNENRINYEVNVKIKHYGYLKSRNHLLEKKYNEYICGNYSITNESSPHFWWGYTIGGNKNEI